MKAPEKHDKMDYNKYKVPKLKEEVNLLAYNQPGHHEWPGCPGS